MAEREYIACTNLYIASGIVYNCAKKKKIKSKSRHKNDFGATLLLHYVRFTDHIMQLHTRINAIRNCLSTKLKREECNNNYNKSDIFATSLGCVRVRARCAVSMKKSAWVKSHCIQIDRLNVAIYGMIGIFEHVYPNSNVTKVRARTQQITITDWKSPVAFAINSALSFYWGIEQ